MVSAELEEVQSEIAKIVENSIKSLESASLTEDQQDMLHRIKTAYEQGDYVRALQLLQEFSQEK